MIQYYLKTTDGNIALLPMDRQGETSGESAIFNRLALGYLNESWTLTLVNGVTMTYNHTTGKLTLHRQGLSDYIVTVVTLANITNESRLYMCYDSSLASTSSIYFIAYNKIYSGKQRSSGVDHYFCIADSNTTEGDYTTLTAYLSNESTFRISRWVNMIGLGGYFGWKQTAFSNDTTYFQAIYYSLAQVNTASVNNQYVYAFLYDAIITDQPTPTGDDPFSPGGVAETGGGEGTYGEDRFGDGIDDEAVDIPDYDPLDEYARSVVGTGFVHIYSATKAQLLAFSNYLWNTPTLSDILKRMYSNPFDAVISLHMIPVSVSGTSQNILIGGQDSGVGATGISNQYVTISCGSLNIGEFWGAYLDYSPFTKLYLYLPFCGMHEVDVDEFMGKTMSIRYDVDIVTGDCLASVSAVTDGGAMTRVLYQYQGNCSVEIPVSGQNYNAKVSAYMGLIGTAFGIGAGVASGGMSAAAGVGAALAGSLNVVSAKGSIQRSGALSGSTAWMSCLKPYLILVQPTQCLPDGQNQFTGYPAFITASVGDLSGYTEFEEIHLSGISATDEEKAEIEAILKGGVLL